MKLIIPYSLLYQFTKYHMTLAYLVWTELISCWYNLCWFWYTHILLTISVLIMLNLLQHHPGPNAQCINASKYKYLSKIINLNLSVLGYFRCHLSTFSMSLTLPFLTSNSVLIVLLFPCICLTLWGEWMNTIRPYQSNCYKIIWS